MNRLYDRLNTIITKESGFYSIAAKNLRTGKMLIINPAKLRSASLIKIFIMIEAFNQASQGQLDLSTKKAITADRIVGGSGSLQTAPAGTEKTVLELIRLMIVESDNIATNILIEQLHIHQINAMIRSLGCHDTILQRTMMDFSSAALGRENFTSAGDILIVLEKLYRHRCLGPAGDQTMLAILKQQEDRDKIPRLLPQDITVAHKTGELDGLAHDAGIIYGRHTDYLLCVMAEDLPDFAHGAGVIAAISRAAYEELDRR